jgi:hypothetical protein
VCQECNCKSYADRTEKSKYVVLARTEFSTKRNGWNVLRGRWEGLRGRRCNTLHRYKTKPPDSEYTTPTLLTVSQLYLTKHQKTFVFSPTPVRNRLTLMAFLFISTLERFVPGDKWSSFLLLWWLTSHPRRSYTDQQFTQMTTIQMLLLSWRKLILHLTHFWTVRSGLSYRERGTDRVPTHSGGGGESASVN